MSVHHAVDTSEQYVYFVLKGRVVGVGHILGRAGSITVEPACEAAKAFFADDYAIPIIGSVYNLRYSPYTGTPMMGFSDEPEDRHKGTIVIGKLMADLGIAPPELGEIIIAETE